MSKSIYFICARFKKCYYHYEGHFKKMKLSLKHTLNKEQQILDTTWNLHK